MAGDTGAGYRGTDGVVGALTVWEDTVAAISDAKLELVVVTTGGRLWP